MRPMYGAGESNSTEAAGLAAFTAGLTALFAGWAYGTDVVQIVVMVLGLAGLVGGVAVLRAARDK